MRSFRVHQTFDNKGKENRDKIIGEMGIYGDKTDLFLGKGFYYWENSEDAIIWGEKHYCGNYVTIAGHLQLDMNKLFDLSYFESVQKIQNLIKQWKRANKHSGDLYLGMFIDIIRSMQQEKLEVNEIEEAHLPFPYLYSRAIDNTVKPQFPYLAEFAFRKGAKSYYHTKPVGFFCVYNRKDLNLTKISVSRERVNEV